MKIKTFAILFFVILFSSPLKAQKEISFISDDGLEIVADLYLKNKSNPFILLFHQSESSRGEYREIAKKLLNLNYNCLAVDLRHGNKINHVINQTVRNAERKEYATGQTEALKDIQASIDYVFRQYQQPVILFGSVFSGSLAMLAAHNNFKVKAVVAFSPGEYFQPHFTVKKKLISFDKPLFIAASTVEKPYIREMVSNVPDDRLTTFFLPENNNVLGARALWDDHENNQKYWFELFVFFKDLKKK